MEIEDLKILKQGFKEGKESMRESVLRLLQNDLDYIISLIQEDKKRNDVDILSQDEAVRDYINSLIETISKKEQ